MNFKYLLLVTIFISCGKINKTLNDAIETDPIKANETNSPYVSTIQIKLEDLQERVFESGSAIHYMDTCAFIFECDCCNGELIFNSDSTFYYKDFCMADVTLLTGKYSISENKIILEYGGQIVSKNYNWENEVDTSAVDFFITDTIIDPFTIYYLPERCNNKIKLNDIENEVVTLETNNTYKSTIDLLKIEGLIN